MAELAEGNGGDFRLQAAPVNVANQRRQGRKSEFRNETQLSAA